MNRLSALVALLALFAGQAGATVASTNDISPSMDGVGTACALPGKANKIVKPARRVNSCAKQVHPVHLGSVPVVFTTAAVAGVILIGVSTKHDNNPASP